jgi:release factor glutamine methyltransferase
MLTVLEIIRKTTEFFAARGVEQPRLNAELLVGHGLGLKRMQLYLQFERPLTEPELERIRPLVRRRAQHEPIQYVMGATEFFGLKLKTDRRALVPRPETERLVELILERPGFAPGRVLDLGTGTGAIALALAAKLPGAAVVGVDRSVEALGLARENAAANALEARVSWIESDWFSAVPTDPPFDLIVSNPPYLTPAELKEAAVEVREFEPHSALVGGGERGADYLLLLIAQAPRYLSPGGLLALETGIAQHAILREAVASAGLIAFESSPDLTGRDRYVFATRP